MGEKLFSLKEGYQVYYKNAEEDYYVDEVKIMKSHNKTIYYGEYLKNGANSRQFDSLTKLLRFYLDNFINVKVKISDDEFVELKNFKEDIDYVKTKGEVLLKKDIVEDYRIEILKLKAPKRDFFDFNYYFLEYKNNELVSYCQIPYFE